MDFIQALFGALALWLGISLLFIILLFILYILALIFIIRWCVKQAVNRPALVITMAALFVFGGVLIILASEGILTAVGATAIASGLTTIILAYTKLNKGHKK